MTNNQVKPIGFPLVTTEIYRKHLAFDLPLRVRVQSPPHSHIQPTHPTLVLYYTQRWLLSELLPAYSGPPREVRFNARRHLATITDVNISDSHVHSWLRERTA